MSVNEFNIFFYFVSRYKSANPGLFFRARFFCSLDCGGRRRRRSECASKMWRKTEEERGGRRGKASRLPVPISAAKLRILCSKTKAPPNLPLSLFHHHRPECVPGFCAEGGEKAEDFFRPTDRPTGGGSFSHPLSSTAGGKEGEENINAHTIACSSAVGLFTPLSTDAYLSLCLLSTPPLALSSVENALRRAAAVFLFLLFVFLPVFASYVYCIRARAVCAPKCRLFSARRGKVREEERRKRNLGYLNMRHARRYHRTQPEGKKIFVPLFLQR